MTVTTVKSKAVLQAALIPQTLTQHASILPEAKKAVGVWDTMVSSVAPRNEVTGNRNFVFLPKSFESFIGNFSYKVLLEAHGGKSFQTEKSQLINLVKEQLLPHVRRKFEWDIQLVSDKKVNAFALPGGKIIICEGLIDKIVDYLRDNVDQIQSGLSKQSAEEQAAVLGKELQSMVAAVIGHEMAHADIGHTRSTLQTVILFYFVISIAYLFLFIVSFGNSSKRQLFEVCFRLYQLAQSRGNEYEADAIGMQAYMHQAGFDLNGAVRLMDMFDKMKSTGHEHRGVIDKIQEFFSTHPLSHNRKIEAEKIRDRVKALHL